MIPRLQNRAIVASVVAVFAGCAAPRPDVPPPRLNVLVLYADDQRADTIAALGNLLIRTPNLDELVRRGFRFSRNYCMGSPHGAVCIPSRAMLHQGRTLYRAPHDIVGFPTISETLRADGYTAFGTGKWHNGMTSFARMFDAGKSIMFGGMSDHTKVPLRDLLPDGSFSDKREGAGFSSTIFADAAIEFLESRDRTQPFFAYVALTAPHDPRQAPPEYLAMYDADDMQLPPNFLPQHPFDNGVLTTRDEKLGAWPRTPELVRSQTAEYFALITHMDHQIGRVLDALERTGDADNTLIVYAADHGLAVGSHGLLGKQSVYEHSMRAPLVFVGPGVPHGVSKDFSYLLDVFPTICALTDTSVPETVEGRSLASAWRGGMVAPRTSIYTSFGTTMRAVRDDRWKLIRYPRIDRTQLFDLHADPHEIHDLSEDSAHASTVQRMMQLLADWQKDVDDDLPLRVDVPMPGEVDLSGTSRQPDKWQPEWIVEKYFNDA